MAAAHFSSSFRRITVHPLVKARTLTRTTFIQRSRAEPKPTRPIEPQRRDECTEGNRAESQRSSRLCGSKCVPRICASWQAQSRFPPSGNPMCNGSKEKEFLDGNGPPLGSAFSRQLILERIVPMLREPHKHR